jgi:hypothetical protein
MSLIIINQFREKIRKQKILIIADETSDKSQHE